jgi:LPS export ABC transporter protein LptC
MRVLFKAHILILIFFSIAILSMFYHSLNLDYDANVPQPLKSVNVLVKDLELTINNPDGSKKAKLWSTSIQHNPKTNLTNLRKPILDIKQENTTWHITSDNGSINHNHAALKNIEFIDLKDNVVVIRTDKLAKNNNNNVKIETTKLTYYPKEDIIYTEQEVKITTKDSVTTAIGLKYNNKNQNIQLLSNVKTIYLKNS